MLCEGYLTHGINIHTDMEMISQCDIVNVFYAN